MKNIYDKIRTLEVTTARQVNGLFAGNYRSSFQGSGIEVDDVRPYVFGDNAKNIDWITTAKLGHPYVKKFTETRELSTFIIIDVSASMQFTSQTNGVRKAEVALETAAILMFSALKNNEAVGAILFAKGVKKFIPPKKGKRHVLRILREIVDAYDNPRQEKSDLAPALDHFNRVIKKHPICFLITDQEEFDEAAKRALRVANLKNDLVCIHVSDPFEKDIGGREYILLYDLEDKKQGEFFLANRHLRTRYKKLRAAKEAKRLSLLRRAGIDWLEVSTAKKVYPLLFTFFKHRQRLPKRT